MLRLDPWNREDRLAAPLGVLVFVGLFFGTIFYFTGLRHVIHWLGAALALGLVITAVRAVSARWRNRQANAVRVSLSRDEWARARSKLLKPHPTK